MSYTVRRMLMVVLIALAIAVLIIGLVLFVKSRGELARHGAPAGKPTQVATDASSKPTTDGSSSGAVVTSTGSGSSTETTTSPQTDTANELPTTGPSQDVATIVALGALTFSLAYFVQSVRARRAQAPTLDITSKIG